MNGGELSEFFNHLVARRRAPLGELDPQELSSLGISVQGREAVLDADIELLATETILQHLSGDARRWLASLEVRSATGSTNTDLMRLSHESIDGRVILAETQLFGRGRRGRSWASPFARNIALSIGVEVRRRGQDLGSLSLVVGLAVLKALESHGVADLGLKWPNDLLYKGRKLCGVLIEVDHASRRHQAVIGIGINHGGADLVRQQIDQPFGDLTESAHPPSRNVTAAAVISHVHESTMRFNDQGFASIRDDWDRHHLFAGKEVCVTGGGDDVIGRVLGVSDLGELRLQTDEGEKRLSGGEISMRGVDSPPISV